MGFPTWKPYSGYNRRERDPDEKWLSCWAEVNAMTGGFCTLPLHPVRPHHLKCLL